MFDSGSNVPLPPLPEWRGGTLDSPHFHLLSRGGIDFSPADTGRELPPWQGGVIEPPRLVLLSREALDFSHSASATELPPWSGAELQPPRFVLLSRQPVDFHAWDDARELPAWQGRLLRSPKLNLTDAQQRGLAGFLAAGGSHLLMVVVLVLLIPYVALQLSDTVQLRKAPDDLNVLFRAPLYLPSRGAGGSEGASPTQGSGSSAPKAALSPAPAAGGAKPAASEQSGGGGQQLARAKFELPTIKPKTDTELTILQPVPDLDPKVPNVKLPSVMQWSQVKVSAPRKAFVTPGTKARNPDVPQLDAAPRLAPPTIAPMVADIRVADIVVPDKPPALPVPQATAMPVRTFVPPSAKRPDASAALDIIKGDPINIVTVSAPPDKLLDSLRISAGSQVAAAHSVSDPSAGGAIAPPKPSGESNVAGAGRGQGTGRGPGEGSGTGPGAAARGGGNAQGSASGRGSGGRGTATSSGTNGNGAGTEVAGLRGGSGSGAGQGNGPGSSPGTGSGSGATPGAGTGSAQGTGGRGTGQAGTGNGASGTSNNPGPGSGSGTSNALGNGGGGTGGGLNASLAPPIRIEHPDSRVYDVVVEQSSVTVDASGVGILKGSPVYTVYLPVGTRKNWVMQYAVPKDSTIQKKQGNVVKLGSPGKVSAPVARVTVVPPQSSSQKIVLHGMITEKGEFEGLEAVMGQSKADELMVIPLLKRWIWKPASRDGVPVAVELVILIPSDAG